MPFTIKVNGSTQIAPCMSTASPSVPASSARIGLKVEIERQNSTLPPIATGEQTFYVPAIHVSEMAQARCCLLARRGI